MPPNRGRYPGYAPSARRSSRGRLALVFQTPRQLAGVGRMPCAGPHPQSSPVVNLDGYKLRIWLDLGAFPEQAGRIIAFPI
jgi:hypothetical protein